MHEICSLEFLSVWRDRHVSQELFEIDRRLSPAHENMFKLKTSEMHTRTARGVAHEMYCAPKCKLENIIWDTEEPWIAIPYLLMSCMPPALSVFKNEYSDFYAH